MFLLFSGLCEFAVHLNKTFKYNIGDPDAAKPDGGRNNRSWNSSRCEHQTPSFLAYRPGSVVCPGGSAVHYKRHNSSEDTIGLYHHLSFPKFATKVRDLILKPPGDHPYDTLKTS